MEVPKELATALSNNPGARAKFEKLAPSHQREFIKYIQEAKQSPTRQRRADKTIRMIKEKP